MLDKKKASRDKFYELEQLAGSNPSGTLEQARESYGSLKSQADALTERAMKLKESHENGAIDSINRAFKTSEDAANIFGAADGRFVTELRPAVAALQLHIDNSKSMFEKSDRLLKEYLDGVLGNLTSSMEGVFGLNQAVS